MLANLHKQTLHHPTEVTPQESASVPHRGNDASIESISKVYISQEDTQRGTGVWGSPRLMSSSLYVLESGTGHSAHATTCQGRAGPGASQEPQHHTRT